MADRPDGPEDSGQSEQERIAALEAEVARLRERLGEEGAGAAPPADAPATTEPAAEPARPRLAVIVGEGGRAGAGEPAAPVLPGRSRGKMILVGLIVVAVALAVFLAVFLTISRGFDSLANKAAKTFAPSSGTGASSGGSSGSEGAGSGSGEQRPPGLQPPGL